MSRIVWDETGKKFYSVGLDRGVLYPKGSKGVPWNGLTSVEHNSNGGEANPFYMDGIKYHNEAAPEELSGTIKAFTYPEEFSKMSGYYTNGTGLYYGQQIRETFGLSYRTLIGNDTEGNKHAYKIHLLYNALASPMTSSNSSLSDDTDPEDLSWGFTTKPIRIAALKNTAEIVVDTRTSDPSKIRQLENILYGLDLTNPRLPSPSEVITLFDDWGNLEIHPKYTTGLSLLEYRGLPDLRGDVFTGLFKAPKETRLQETAQLGLYRLEV